MIRYHAIAMTSIVPITNQQAALPRAPANQNPLAALKQRIALVHPLTNAPGLLIICSIFMDISRLKENGAPLGLDPAGKLGSKLVRSPHVQL